MQFNIFNSASFTYRCNDSSVVDISSLNWYPDILLTLAPCMSQVSRLAKHYLIEPYDLTLSLDIRLDAANHLLRELVIAAI